MRHDPKRDAYYQLLDAIDALGLATDTLREAGLPLMAENIAGVEQDIRMWAGYLEPHQQDGPT